MKRYILFLSFYSLFLFAFRSDKNDTVFFKNNFTYAGRQLKNMLTDVGKNKLAFPRTINNSGKLVTTSMYD